MDDIRSDPAKRSIAVGITIIVVEVSGGKATGYFRQTEKDKWQKMAQAELPGKGEAKIGLNAAGGSRDTDRWARFSQFRILEQTE